MRVLEVREVSEVRTGRRYVTEYRELELKEVVRKWSGWKGWLCEPVIVCLFEEGDGDKVDVGRWIRKALSNDGYAEVLVTEEVSYRYWKMEVE